MLSENGAIPENQFESEWNQDDNLTIIIVPNDMKSIVEKDVLSEDKVISYAPTAVKSFARTFLPLEEQKEIKSKPIKDKKTKEIIGYQDTEVLCEMNKKRMIQACNSVAPDDWLDGLTLASGKADYADSFWIGKTYLSGKQPTKKKEK